MFGLYDRQTTGGGRSGVSVDTKKLKMNTARPLIRIKHNYGDVKCVGGCEKIKNK